MLCTFPVKTGSIARLADWIVGRQLTVYISAPSLFRTLTRIIDGRLMFASVRAVILHGEAVTAVHFQAFRRHFQRTSVLVHTLACAEACNIAWSRWMQDDEIPAGALPVGNLSRDTEISLIGEYGQPVPCGEVGEIVVRSRFLANGYWQDPELTAQRFSAALDDNGTRLLRTGDRGRINADGLLEYSGRRDDRIKIRGYRIEPLDIERVIERLSGIDGAAVVAVARDHHEPVLVAFVVKQSNSSWTAQRLGHILRANLPCCRQGSNLSMNFLTIAITKSIERPSASILYLLATTTRVMCRERKRRCDHGDPPQSGIRSSRCGPLRNQPRSGRGETPKADRLTEPSPAC
jgi:acyl-coenzyme A synthetase/AMP-(fatty) acid ligase